MTTTTKIPKTSKKLPIVKVETPKITRNFNINVNKDEPDLNDFLLSFSLFNRRPSKISLYSDFNPEVFWNILNQSYKLTPKSVYCNSEIYPIGDKAFLANHRYTVELNKHIVITFLELDKMPDEETGYITNVIIYYDNSKVEMSDIFKDITPAMIVNSQNDDLPNISMIKYNMNSTLDLEPLMISEENIIKCDHKSFKNYYSDNIIKDINAIIKSFNSADKGLNIFSGEKGTGKTTFLLSIMDKINRKIIYIPNNLVDSVLGNPEFFSMLKRLHNALIVIDDCENFSNNIMRSDSFNSYISQLVDGIQSSAINTQILLIYNNKENTFDVPLNNMLQTYEFTSLSKDKANKLGSMLSNENNYTTDSRLIDVLRDTNPSKIKNALSYA